MKRLLGIALVIALLLLVRLWLSGAGSTPAGQPPLVDLNLDSFRSEFNRESSKTRVVIVISAACPYCLKGATTIQRLLESHRDVPLVAFVVWQPILPNDWGKPQTSPLHRLSDSRVRQFWDVDHKLADALKASFEPRGQEPQCCYQDGIWWDFMVSFPPGGEWKDVFPDASMLGGTVDDVAAEFEALLAKAPRAK